MPVAERALVAPQAHRARPQRLAGDLGAAAPFGAVEPLAAGDAGARRLSMPSDR